MDLEQDKLLKDKVIIRQNRDFLRIESDKVLILAKIYLIKHQATKNLKLMILRKDLEMIYK
jgi:hypothetical protein